MTDADVWFANRFGRRGFAEVFAGVTTPEERRDRIRALIVRERRGAEIVGNRKGRPVTYAEAFEKFYGMPLGGA